MVWTRARTPGLCSAQRNLRSRADSSLVWADPAKLYSESTALLATARCQQGLREPRRRWRTKSASPWQSHPRLTMTRMRRYRHGELGAYSTWRAPLVLLAACRRPREFPREMWLPCTGPESACSSSARRRGFERRHRDRTAVAGTASHRLVQARLLPQRSERPGSHRQACCALSALSVLRA